MIPATRGSMRLTLLLIPSFWGFCTWIIALGAYEMRLLSWYPTSTLASLIFFSVAVAFGLSSLVTRPLYARVAEQIAQRRQSIVESAPLSGPRHAFLLTLHAIGFAGVTMYVLGLSRALGGWRAFVSAVVLAPQLLRWTAAESVGTQLSYLGWVAVGLTVLHIRRRELPSRYWWLVVLQVTANLLFVDRTRPTWIGFTAALVSLSVGVDVSRIRLARGVMIAVLTFLVAYFGVAYLLGKVPDATAYGRTSLPLPLQGFYVYITAGFAYLNEILSRLPPADFHSGRVAYPFWKFAMRVGLGVDPPSQVNDEAWLPFPVNVGTFMEPWYRDGGLLLLAIGVLVQTVLTDVVALLLLRSRRPLGIFAWANLCFASFIAFFTPKLVTFPIWLFLALAIASIVAHTVSPPPDKPLDHSLSLGEGH